MKTPWIANLDWLLIEQNVKKVYEGDYERYETLSSSSSSSPTKTPTPTTTPRPTCKTCCYLGDLIVDAGDEKRTCTATGQPTRTYLDYCHKHQLA